MDYVREQAIALSGLWQATNLVYDLAHGELDQQQKKRFDCSSRSILVMEAKDSEQVFGSIDNLQFSLLGLYSFFKRKHKGRPNVMLYMMQLMRLQHIMSKDREMSQYIATEIKRLSAQKQFFEDQQPVLIENYARIYSETLGSMNMKNRIKVSGVAEVLQKTEVQSSVRAMLLAAIRSVTLWKQMGGNRLHLVFKRRQIEEALAKLVTY